MRRARRRRQLRHRRLKAFAAAQRLTCDDLAITSALMVMLPWLTAHVDEARALMGDDFWPAASGNRNVLDTFLRYHHEQDCGSGAFGPRLFAPETLESLRT